MISQPERLTGKVATEHKRQYRFASPLGELIAVAARVSPAAWALTDLHIASGKGLPRNLELIPTEPSLDVFSQLRNELSAYFAGTSRTFSVPLAPSGTPFQQAAWQQLLRIPYGQTQSYGQQALAIGQPGAARAVGAANARNPIAILIPCHRVIGADGSLTGYAGGIDHKRWLLSHESRFVQTT